MYVAQMLAEREVRNPGKTLHVPALLEGLSRFRSCRAAALECGASQADALAYAKSFLRGFGEAYCEAYTSTKKHYDEVNRLIGELPFMDRSLLPSRDPQSFSIYRGKLHLNEVDDPFDRYY